MAALNLWVRGVCVNPASSFFTGKHYASIVYFSFSFYDSFRKDMYHHKLGKH